VVKPRIKALDEGKPSDQEVRELIKKGVAETRKFFDLAESLMAPEGYIFGDQLTWADFFLFPLVADLRMVPEWQDLGTKRLLNWATKMDDLDAVKATREGTLSVNARP